MNILVRDLFYIYKNNGESIVALRGLNLEARTGECLVIKGPNGSGKSTLVKLLTGYYVPTAGEIIVPYEGTACPHRNLSRGADDFIERLLDLGERGAIEQIPVNG